MLNPELTILSPAKIFSVYKLKAAVFHFTVLFSGRSNASGSSH